MLQLTPQTCIFLATEPVDFRKGIDGLAAVCRQALGANPLEGAVYVLRNRSGTALKRRASFPSYGCSPPYTFFLLNGNMELNRYRKPFVQKVLK